MSTNNWTPTLVKFECGCVGFLTGDLNRFLGVGKAGTYVVQRCDLDPEDEVERLIEGMYFGDRPLNDKNAMPLHWTEQRPIPLSLEETLALMSKVWGLVDDGLKWRQQALKEGAWMFKAGTKGKINRAEDQRRSVMGDREYEDELLGQFNLDNPDWSETTRADLEQTLVESGGWKQSEAAAYSLPQLQAVSLWLMEGRYNNEEASDW
jgi:hypothetical protein